MVQYEGDNNIGPFAQSSLLKKFLVVLGWAALYALSIGINVGGYFLVPYLAFRYRAVGRAQKTEHADADPTAFFSALAPRHGCVTVLDHNGKLTLENVKLTGRLKLV